MAASSSLGPRTPAASLRVDAERPGHKGDRKAFIALPYRLYRGHPTWVPPLRSEERKLMDRAKNPFFDHAEVEHFLARRGGKVVGRIAAIENRLHNETHEDRVGFFGFFDVEPDPEAAAALIAAAREWTEARGLGPMRGPVNYSMNDPCGLLVEGFDESPYILMPYNRPDYEALLLDAGLVPVKDLLAYRLLLSIPAPERFRRVVARRISRRGVTIRTVNMDDFDNEVRTIKDLYNRCWEKNWGFVQATSAEFDHAAKDLKLLLDERLSRIAERDGKAVGFSIFLRDLNALLKGGSGRITPALIWKLLFRLKKIPRNRCVLLGVLPEARGLAINEALMLAARDGALATGVFTCEASWILADNRLMRSPIEAMSGEITKRYRMYESC